VVLIFFQDFRTTRAATGYTASIFIGLLYFGLTARLHFGFPTRLRLVLYHEYPFLHAAQILGGEALWFPVLEEE
jgi:hypothetical protein